GRAAPAGLEHTPPAPTGTGGRSVSISLHVSFADSANSCFATTACTPDGNGLTYLRFQDSQGYVIRHGNVNVQVMGGLLVDKALLRRAALDARPATDEELRRMLPPPKPYGRVDRLRQWLRDQ